MKDEFLKNPEGLEAIKADIKKHSASGNGQDKKNREFKDYGNLKVSSVNSWIEQAARRGRPTMLCGDLWYEGDLAVFYGRPGFGKTVFAYQIADALTKGINSDKELTNEVDPQEVLYLDFEMSGDIIQGRYSNSFGLDRYKFSDKFLRVEKHFSKSLKRDEIEKIPDQVMESLLMLLSDTKSKIVIVDNISFLGNDTQEARNAAVMMSQLNEIKKQKNISMLVLGHPPKIADNEPIRLEHLAGSATIGNFMDSAFAIGSDQGDPHGRYLKQTKNRRGQIILHAGNVLKGELHKEAGTNILKFMSYGFGEEFGMLKSQSEVEREKLEREVADIARNNKGFSQRDISIAAGTSVSTVNRILNKTPDETL